MWVNTACLHINSLIVEGVLQSDWPVYLHCTALSHQSIPSISFGKMGLCKDCTGICTLNKPIFSLKNALKGQKYDNTIVCEKHRRHFTKKDKVFYSPTSVQCSGPWYNSSACDQYIAAMATDHSLGEHETPVQSSAGSFIKR